MHLSSRLTRTLPALALALACHGAGAAVISGNATNLSTSIPRLNAAGNAWEPFSNAQGVPNAGKSIKLLYVADDGTSTGFPLNAAAASVSLRPSTGGGAVICTANPVAPVLTPANAGTCTFRMISTAGNPGDTLEVFYLGLLSGNIRLNAAGLAPAVVGNSVTSFNSDTVLPGTPPSPSTVPPLSRKPARLVAVFDKSGSMDWSAKPGDPACGTLYAPIAACKRWEILKKAAAQMVTVAKAYVLPGDELGVAFFDSTATDTGGIAAMTTVTLDAVNTSLNPPRAPGGNTSIGAGVQRLKAGQLVNNANFNNMTLLFTDGEQNTAPFLVSDGTQLLINATQNQPFGAPWVPAGNAISLCTFRLRADDPAGPAGTTTLQQIADRGCNGMMNSSASLNAQPADLIGFFLQVLNKTLIGDKLELIHKSGGTQAASGTAPPPPLQLPFTASKRDVSLTVLLGWNSAFQADGRPALSLVKDGVEFNADQDPSVLVGTGVDHMALTVREPYCNAARQCVRPEGPWTLQVRRTLPRGTGAYQLFVIGDNATFASDFTVTQPQPGIGRPLQLKATLTDGGAPLAGLAPGSVRAFISAPAASLGNVLAASGLRGATQAPTDPNTPAGLKVQAMLADPVERARILAALELGAEQGIPLTESSPGVYTAAFPGTAAEGIYRVSFRVQGSNTANAGFTRVYDTDRYVPVQPDDAATARTLTVAPYTDCDARFAGGCVRLTLKPVDAAGNLVGPGKGSVIFPKTFDGQVIGSVQDQLDGSYTLVLGYNRLGAAPPALGIGGLDLNLPPQAGSAGGVGGGQHGWWWWLVLLILAALAL